MYPRTEDKTTLPDEKVLPSVSLVTSWEGTVFPTAAVFIWVVKIPNESKLPEGSRKAGVCPGKYCHVIIASELVFPSLGTVHKFHVQASPYPQLKCSCLQGNMRLFNSAQQ